MKSLLLSALSLLAINTNAQDCVDLGPYSQSYLDSVTNDHVTYPVGTAFVTTGNISYVKPDQMSFYQEIMGDTLFYIGNLDIDVSAETCPNKELTFSCAYLEGLAVDGDTIFSQLNPPANYVGNGFEFEYDGNGEYIVTGDFDIVSLYTQTNFLWDVCLECVPDVISSDCIDLGPYSQQYLDSVTYDHVNYPPGTAFITTGNISLVKPDQMSFYQGIQGDTLFYIGNIDIDVSAETCATKRLTFSSVYLEGLAVDGDTIFSQLNPPAFYAGNGFTFEYVDAGQHAEFTITGDFDVASLFTQTNFLFDICLECLVAQVDEISSTKNDVLVYPNPTDGELFIELFEGAALFTVYDLQGNVVKQGGLTQENKVDLSGNAPGVYILSVRLENGQHVMQRIQLSN